MYEITKKHRVSPAVEKAFPAEVIKQIWQVVGLMAKAGQIVTSPVAIIFSDDFTDDECYAMMIQGDVAPAQEFPIAYSGEKTFLGHAWILIVKDRPQTITIDFSEANDLPDELKNL
ncbi:hypothetical protein [Lacticaseibacillus songhuajiangensis]|jgi:hypothetical protein|uniref:hypothetical protein n=1 Tax=Lacticaseibacillus songhuajiangensis TaxID=1296539 RepID=UPI000F771266|nr:hypothetical protein [Lacticaseibacillus songhuajiangensis]